MEEPQVPQLTAHQAYVHLTKMLMLLKRTYSFMLNWQPESYPEREYLTEPLNRIFAAHDWRRCGRKMSYTEWNVNGVFPLILYEECERDLYRMLDDPRLTSDATYMKQDAWNSFVGRTARTRPLIPQGMLAYALDRLRKKSQRGFNHFYLAVEDPEWVFKPLAENPRLPKTGRTSVACIMNFSINVDTRRNVLHLNTIMRSSLWSHVYGDIFGATYFADALLNHLQDPDLTAICHIYFPCISMDTPRQAHTFIQAIDKPAETKKLLDTIQ